MVSFAHLFIDFGCVKNVHRFFRTMALRHLVVINAAYEPIGIVTRRDLTYSQLFDKSIQKVRDVIIECMLILPH